MRRVGFGRSALRAVRSRRAARAFFKGPMRHRIVRTLSPRPPNRRRRPIGRPQGMLMAELLDRGQASTSDEAMLDV